MKLKTMPKFINNVLYVNELFRHADFVVNLDRCTSSKTDHAKGWPKTILDDITNCIKVLKYGLLFSKCMLQ